MSPFAQKSTHPLTVAGRCLMGMRSCEDECLGGVGRDDTMWAMRGQCQMKCAVLFRLPKLAGIDQSLDPVGRFPAWAPSCFSFRMSGMPFISLLSLYHQPLSHSIRMLILSTERKNDSDQGCRKSKYFRLVFTFQQVSCQSHQSWRKENWMKWKNRMCCLNSLWSSWHLHS